jgi:2-oxo-4-hydroxy-4-carboxy-5-ureidoimidazoline decarboxylase
MSKISLDELNRMTPAEFVGALAGIFEHSPWVAEAVVGQRPFATRGALHEAMKAAVRAVGDAKKLAFLRQHPELAGKAAQAGAMTADSQSEQDSAGLGRLSAQEFERLSDLNKAYAAKFGFPFIICVRRHTRDSLFRQFASRLQHTIAAEMDAALLETFRITALRLDQHVSAEDRLGVHGFMDVHVIDLQRGQPASGLALELRELSASGFYRVLAACSSNARGVTEVPFFEHRPIPIGQYELRFWVGDYFGRSGEAANLPFLDIVPVRFAVAEPEGCYHIPLRITPWTYTVYRGQ